MNYTPKQFSDVLSQSQINYNPESDEVRVSFDNNFFFLEATMNLYQPSFEADFGIQGILIPLTEEQKDEIEQKMLEHYNEIQDNS